ncbi:MAG: Hint domain-containing protein [Pseudomonadota bacterium]
MAGYISEVNVYGAQAGGDFVEIAFPSGTDVSGYEVYAYRADGTIYSGPFSLGSIQSTQNGEDIYVVDADHGFSASYDSSIALIDDSGNVVQFISDDNHETTATEGPAAGQTSEGVGRFSGSETTQSSNGGQSYYNAPATKGSIACFAEGTLIETSKGLQPVEALRAGDLVQTYDQGLQPLMWTGMTTGGAEEKVLIRAGCLGHRQPKHDLLLSAQHRILVGEAGQLGTQFDRPSIVSAKALTALPGISMMRATPDDRWYHIACASHAIVLSNGLATETLLIGPMVRSGRYGRSLTACFGEVIALDGYTNGPPARPILRVGVTRRFIAQEILQAA